ncbi:MAG: hypothetical protein IIC80_01460 [Chloroflexi bacterium]|nr:hypothetical protein [Chloroflexota bacterium]MCI0769862.1 hypothetical protein [Chloroflexota bacterium]
MTQTRPTTHDTPRDAARPGPSPTCHVCRKAIDDPMDSTCRSCGRPVHVAWAQGQPESACSQLIAPQTCCGIAFVCNPCAHEEEREAT